MSILEYANKFMELSRFAPELVTSEQSRMNHFERGVQLKYQDRLASQRFTSYKDMVDILVNVERVVLLRESKNSNFKRNDSGQSHYRGQGYHGGNRVLTTGHLCGSRNHYVKDYPKPSGTNNGIGGTSSTGTNRNGNNNTVGAYRNPPQQAPTGRIYVMRQDEAENDDTVITDTFSIHSLPVHLLFDSRASHSFISALFAKSLKLQPSCDFPSLSFALPTGEIVRCGVMYRICPILLGKVEFLVDLVEFELSEFDVILGMNWLTKYEADINCVKHSVTLKAPYGRRLS
ncbi:uncharacterized protein LOC104907555 [Beta vulgaris subsp. vulgaris]|uniref:uncharacterized protein LOC104907555 n=1 Tax=Beta vulgaris subsp. vulgaris TaxID=3555 RepID=UPI002036A581|nr:uncharacterized protein LOC104907555 [Beta vulgaris subsp. vulgaris]